MATESSAYFRLLGSLLYNEPDIQTIDMLLSEDLFNELPYACDNELAVSGQAQLNAWLKSADAKTLAEDVSIDYMNLLVGVGKPLAPPWGSVYLDKDRLLFSEDTLNVRQFYEHYGMELKKKYSEPDDHIGLELEFIAYLLKSGKADLARDFAEKYVIPWVSKWNDDVQKYARTDYYRALSKMAAAGVQALCSN